MSHRIFGRTVMLTAATAMSTLLFAGVANAAAPMTKINGATVNGASVLVSVTYSCDRSSGAVQLTAVVDDTTSGALGSGSAVPTCDSQSHTVNVTVNPSHGTFTRGDNAKISTDLLDVNGVSVGGSSSGTFTLG